MDPVTLGTSIPILILSGIGIVWSLSLLVTKRIHSFRNILLFLASTGLFFSYIVSTCLAMSYGKSLLDEVNFLIYYRLSVAANFFLYVNTSLLWCAAVDVFRTSIPKSDKNRDSPYKGILAATYFAYTFTVVMIIVDILQTVYISPEYSSSAMIKVNPIGTSSFLMFGQWAFPILFLIQYHQTSSKKSVSTFSTSLWTLFGILTLITILNTADQALFLTVDDFYASPWINWVSNSLFVSFAILFLCCTGSKWVVSRKHHARLSWSEQFDEPEHGLVGRGSVSRIRPMYGGRSDAPEEIHH